MSASKNDRLGRNPFDRGTYSQAPKAAKQASSRKSGTKTKKSSRRAFEPRPVWKALLSELDRRAPQAVRDLKICKRVAALADIASARLSQFARHLEA